MSTGTYHFHLERLSPAQVIGLGMLSFRLMVRPDLVEITPRVYLHLCYLYRYVLIHVYIEKVLAHTIFTCRGWLQHR